MEDLHKNNVVWSWGRPLTKGPLYGWDVKEDERYLEIEEMTFTGFDNSHKPEKYKSLYYMDEKSKDVLLENGEAELLDKKTFFKKHGLKEF